MECAVSKYTHRGWFGICPILIGNLHTECPCVQPINRWVVPLFWVSEKGQGAFIWLRTYLNPHYVPEWKLIVTRALND